MSTVEQSIDINVPVRVAYDQWTQFESFPQFMDGIEEVRQFDDTHLHWRAKHRRTRRRVERRHHRADPGGARRLEVDRRHAERRSRDVPPPAATSPAA